MSHACEILTFKASMSKRAISDRCDEWANHNCDPWEHGGHYDCGGLYGGVRFTSKVFNTEREAMEYLQSTFGNYSQIAVQYKVPLGKAPSPTQKLLAARKKAGDCYQRLRAFDKPHYAGVSSKTVTCKKCGSSLATAFCGKSYNNNCPVCRADLRPPSTLEALAKAQQNYKQATKELEALERGFETKQTSQKYELYWAVACEVHC